MWRCLILGEGGQELLGVVLQGLFPTVSPLELLSSCECWSRCSKDEEHP